MNCGIICWSKRLRSGFLKVPYLLDFRHFTLLKQVRGTVLNIFVGGLQYCLHHHPEDEKTKFRSTDQADVRQNCSTVRFSFSVRFSACRFPREGLVNPVRGCLFIESTAVLNIPFCFSAAKVPARGAIRRILSHTPLKLLAGLLVGCRCFFMMLLRSISRDSPRCGSFRKNPPQTLFGFLI